MELRVWVRSHHLRGVCHSSEWILRMLQPPAGTQQSLGNWLLLSASVTPLITSALGRYTDTDHKNLSRSNDNMNPRWISQHDSSWEWTFSCSQHCVVTKEYLPVRNPHWVILCSTKKKKRMGAADYRTNTNRRGPPEKDWNTFQHLDMLTICKTGFTDPRIL